MSSKFFKTILTICLLGFSACSQQALPKTKLNTIAQFKELVALHLGHDEYSPDLELSISDEEILKDLTYVERGIIGELDGIAFKSGNTASIGFIGYKELTGIGLAGVGTLIRNDANKRCRILTAWHVIAQDDLSALNPNREFYFMRPKEKGIGAPVKLTFNGQPDHNKIDGRFREVPVALQMDQDVTPCLNYQDITLGKDSIELYERFGNASDQSKFSVVSPVNGKNRSPYFFYQDISNHFYRLLTKRLATDIDGLQGMSGSPLLTNIDGRVTVVGVLSTGARSNCPKFQKHGCHSDFKLLTELKD